VSNKKKKKFKETKVGAFLTERAPNIVSQVGEFLPDQGALGIVKNIITSDTTIEPQDKETALKLLEQDIQEMKDVSARWHVAWVELLKTLLITVYVAYFGSRGAEKITNINKK